MNPKPAKVALTLQRSEQLRSLLEWWRQSRTRFLCSWLGDQALLSLPTPVPSGARAAHYVLAPPGAGNIGDQALVEAFLHNVDGGIALMVRDPGDFEIPAETRARVEVLTMPDLVYGSVLSRARAVFSLRRHLSAMTSFSIVGADVMDGAHNSMASLHRWSLANAMAKRGVPTRVLGFSWNERPHRNSLRALAAVSREVVLCVRDPLSFSRIQRAGGSQGILVADMVFSLSPGVPSAARSRVTDGSIPEVDSKTVLVNVSGLVAKSLSQLDEYRVLVDGLLDDGWNVVVIPHVSRPGGDDVPACRDLAELYPSTRLTLIDAILPPLEVSELAAAAAMVVTARMHLGVLAIARGTPAVIVSTQGKVDGLVDLAQGYAVAVNPTAGMGANLLAAVRQLGGPAGRDPELPAKLRSLARANFAFDQAVRGRHGERAKTTGEAVASEAHH